MSAGLRIAAKSSMRQPCGSQENGNSGTAPAGNAAIRSPSYPLLQTSPGSGCSARTEAYAAASPMQTRRCCSAATFLHRKRVRYLSRRILQHRDADAHCSAIESHTMRIDALKAPGIARTQPIRIQKAFVIHTHRCRVAGIPNGCASAYSIAHLSAAKPLPIWLRKRYGDAFRSNEQDRVQVPNFQYAPTKNMAFVIFITTKLQKKRNMFDEENDKSTRLPAAARQS